MDTGTPGAVLLPPSPPPAQRPNQASQLEVAHGPMLPRNPLPWPYRTLTEGLRVGDEVELTLARDDSPRTLELAPELEAALTSEPDMRQRFDALSFSRRRELADPIAQAKRPETRQARLEKTLARLRELT